MTRNQAAVIAAARRDGKVAFFKKGKLTVEPRRPDSRTYVKVTTADDAGAAINPPRSSQLIGSTMGVKCHVKTAAVMGIPRVSTTRTESVPFLHVQTMAVHRVSVDPGNPDCPTTGVADGVLATRNAQPRRSERASTRRR